MKIPLQIILLIQFIFISSLLVRGQKIIIDENTAVNPYAVVTGFVDMDSIPDVVYTSYYSDCITWLRGQDSSGTNYIAYNIINDSIHNSRLQIGDVDNDGDGDFVFINFVDYLVGLSFLENKNGIGTEWEFHFCEDYLSSPVLMALIDMDSDGDLDAVESDNILNKIIWIENIDGAGNFSITHTISDTYDNVINLTFGDIDNDDDPDLIVLGNLTEISILINSDGLGNFVLDTIIDVYTNLTIVRMDDLDSDGDPDILIGGNHSFAYPSLIWYENADGAGLIGVEHVIDDSNLTYYNITIRDMDNDTDNDIITSIYEDAMETTELKWLENNGDGSDFSVQHHISDPIAGTVKFGVADANFDLIPDVFAIFNSTIELFKSQAIDSSFDFPIAIVPAALIWRALLSMDVDGDGDADIVMEDEKCRVFWYEFDNVLESFIAKHVISDVEKDPAYGYLLAKADINNDGLEEIFITYNDYYNYVTSYFKNLGGGNFSEEVWLNNFRSYFIWAEDIDIDGDKDLITFADYGDVHWSYNLDGEGAFGPTQNLGVDGYAYTVLDYDLDGDVDIVGHNGTVKFFENIAGTFVAGIVLSDPVCGPSIYFLPFDYDIDGDIDFIYSCPSYESFVENIMLMKDTGVGFSLPTGDIGKIKCEDTQQNYFDLVDIDNDGLKDMVYSTYYNIPGYFTPQTNFALNNGGGFDDYTNFNNDYGIFSDIDNNTHMDFVGYEYQYLYWIKNAIPIYPLFTAGLNNEFISEDGLTDTLFLKFENIPSDTIVLKISVDDDMDIGAGTGLPIYAEFYPDSSALSIQKFILHANDDAEEEGWQSSVLEISNESGMEVYADLVHFIFNVNIIDNDMPPGLTFSESESFITESGYSGGNEEIFFLNLNSLPLEFVTVTLQPDFQIDLGAGAGNPTDIEFSPDVSCFEPKQIQITSVNDIVPEGIHFGLISISVSSTDIAYDVLNDTIAEIEIHDNDYTINIDELPTAPFYIIPNPSAGVSFLYFNKPLSLSNSTLEIYSQNGGLVKSIVLSSSSGQMIDMQSEMPGIYFIKLIYNSDTWIGKLILN